MNNEIKFKEDLKFMSKTYFNASDRLKYEAFVISILNKMSAIIVLLSSIIILIDNYNNNKILSIIMLATSLYLIIINDNINILERSKKFLNSGNKIKDILRSLNDSSMNIIDAKERYNIIIDLNENRGETDRLIALDDDTNSRKKLLKNLYIKIWIKYLSFYIITIIIAIIVSVINMLTF